MAKFFKKINFVSRLSKLKWKNVFSLLLSILLIIAMIAGLVKIFQKSEETEKTIHPSFSVGSLTENGTYDPNSDKTKIYTKDWFECKGLKITLDFDNSVQYQVYLYGEYGDFLSHTPWMKDSYELTDNYARYARLVVDSDTDDNILFFETFKLSNQLHIEVSKNQVFVEPEENELSNKCTVYSDKTATLSGNVVGLISGTNVGCKVLNCRNFSKVRLTWNQDEKSSIVACYFVNANNELVGTSVSISAGLTETDIAVPSGATAFYINYAVGHVPSVYQTK